MKLIGRLRHGGSALVLFAALILLAPLMDCSLVDSDEHSHTQSAPITTLVASISTDLSYPNIGDDTDHCAPNTVHCVIKSALAKSAGSLAPLYLLLFVLTVAMLVTLVHRVSASGVRGPPVAAVPVVSGRILLTRFCIARR